MVYMVCLHLTSLGFTHTGWAPLPRTSSARFARAGELLGYTDAIGVKPAGVGMVDVGGGTLLVTVAVDVVETVVDWVWVMLV